MKRIISLSALALVLAGGVASADPRSRTTVRDHRSNGGVSITGRGSFDSHASRRVDRGHRTGNDANVGHRSSVRAPIYLQGDGRFHFDGQTIGYRRPAITQSHFDQRHRPTPLVESYQSVRGYTWTPGAWEWTGSQWVWTAGHYENTGYSSSYSPDYSSSYSPDYSSTYENTGSSDYSPDYASSYESTGSSSSYSPDYSSSYGGSGSWSYGSDY